MSTVPLFVLRRAVRARTATTFLQQSRSAGYWNRDWRPNTELPKTEEERRAAAKKYGLIPEDYETYPDDGTGYGDYPKLPMISAESRDPHALYDCPEYRRNFGEPMHVDADMIGEDRWDITRRLRHSYPQMLGSYVGCMTAAFLLYLLGEEFRICYVRMMPQHRIHDGKDKTHYSFELEDVE